MNELMVITSHRGLDNLPLDALIRDFGGVYFEHRRDSTERDFWDCGGRNLDVRLPVTVLWVPLESGPE